MPSKTPATAPFTVRTRTLKLRLEGGFRLVSGAVLPEVEVAYETYGRLQEGGGNAIFICSPLTTDAHAAGFNPDSDPAEALGWWDEMVGPGKAIDTDRFFVISSNMLGGCKGTTGPMSLDPRTGRPYGSSFPKITVEDIVNVQRALALELGVDRLFAVIGGSMGGMQALQWSVSFPGKVDKCICIAAAAGLSAQALGFEILARKAILSDPAFRGGDYYQKSDEHHKADPSPAGPAGGLRFARMIGHLTYLSFESMHHKFGRNKRAGYREEAFETGFEVESYLEHQGEKFLRRFDANSYLHITYAMDHFDLEARYGSLARAFEKAESDFLLVALSSDWLFPPEQARRLCRELLGLRKVVSLVELDSPYGHDAFLLEVEHLTQVIGAFLNRPERAAESSARTIRVGADRGAAPALSPPPRPSAAAETVYETPSKCFSSEEDFLALRDLVPSGSHILDIGCGDGALIDSLYRSHGVTGVGIDISLWNGVSCLARNVPVLQSDVDQGLPLVKDGLFDYAVLNRTLQVVKKPSLVLREMLRVAEKGIVSFPNFGYYQNRLALGLQGVMPVNRELPYSWYDTPNIHLFTLEDFRRLCAEEGLRIEKMRCTAGGFWGRRLLGLGLKNAGAELVIARIGRA